MPGERDGSAWVPALPGGKHHRSEKQDSELQDVMMPLRDTLERRQIAVYAAAIGAAVVAGLWLPATRVLAAAINPALGLMLFVTFLQVPLTDLGRAFGDRRFLAALAVANFIAVPALVAVLLPFLPADPGLRLGVLLVLLAPCIDYVVTFAHLGRADSRSLLAATPILLAGQMALLPLFLHLFLGGEAASVLRAGPFVEAFVWLILLPLALAAALQARGRRSPVARRVVAGCGLLPVPATALVLFVVIAAAMPLMGSATAAVLQVVPVYAVFAVVAPLIGLGIGRLFGLAAPAARAVGFSAATRNSLVILPLAFAVPDAVPLLPAVIVTQTLVELVSELVYVRVLPAFGRSAGAGLSPD